MVSPRNCRKMLGHNAWFSLIRFLRLLVLSLLTVQFLQPRLLLDGRHFCVLSFLSSNRPSPIIPVCCVCVHVPIPPDLLSEEIISDNIRLPCHLSCNLIPLIFEICCGTPASVDNVRAGGVRCQFYNRSNDVVNDFPS